MKKLVVFITCCSFALSANGEILDVSGLESWNLDGAIDNQTKIFHPSEGGFFGVVLRISYDFTIQTSNDSWISDVNVRFGNSDGTFHGIWPDVFSPGLGADFAGTQRFTGIFSTDLHLNPDGEFRVSLFESRDDNANAADAVLLGGSTMTIDFFIPSPSSGIIFCMSTLLATRRKR